MEKKEKESDYKTYMVRYYDDGHTDGDILWEFRILKTIFEGCYSWEWIAEREDGMIWSLKEHEVSWMYNPKNWWTKMTFDEFWTREEILERLS